MNVHAKLVISNNKTRKYVKYALHYAKNAPQKQNRVQNATPNTTESCKKASVYAALGFLKLESHYVNSVYKTSLVYNVTLRIIIFTKTIAFALRVIIRIK